MEQKTFIQRAGDFIFYVIVALLALLASASLIAFTLIMAHLSLNVAFSIRTLMGYY